MSTNILRRRSILDTNQLTQSNLPPLLTRLYAQRGINNIKELQHNMQNLLTYQELFGIETAVNILVDAFLNKHNLLIVGDFDVDGATSVALMVLSLKKMGAYIVNFLVPNRFKDGYGLSTSIVEQAILLNTQLIITVDNGISSHVGVALAKNKGIKVIITDHHIPSDIIPMADAIVNPNLYKCSTSLKSLAGVGVAFYFMLALREQLNKQNWFKQKKIQPPNLAQLLDLVALGTIADMVPLDFNNRILVHQGLNRIRAGYCRPGIYALAKITNLNLSRLRTSDLSFTIVPRLNAAGRLNNMSLSVLLLLTNNISCAYTLASNLNNLNKVRRKIANNMEEEALSLCCDIINKQGKIPLCFILYRDNWHQGIIGILATRVMERFHRPVIAFSRAENGLLKGSGRSITKLHLYNLLKRLNILYPNIILNYGGHAMAIGITLEQSQFAQFTQYFTELINKILHNTLLSNIIWSDGELTQQEFSFNTVNMIYQGGPWGTNFPEPLFDGRFYILSQQILGLKHLQLKLKPITGGPILNGIIFNVDLHFWPNTNISIVEIAYKLEINYFFKQPNLQLLISHIWPI